MRTSVPCASGYAAAPSIKPATWRQAREDRRNATPMLFTAVRRWRQHRVRTARPRLVVFEMARDRRRTRRALQQGPGALCSTCTHELTVAQARLAINYRERKTVVLFGSQARLAATSVDHPPTELWSQAVQRLSRTSTVVPKA